MKDVDASSRGEERRRERGRGEKKLKREGQGKRMLTDCKAISDPPPTHRASIRLDIQNTHSYKHKQCEGSHSLTS